LIVTENNLSVGTDEALGSDTSDVVWDRRS